MKKILLILLALIACSSVHASVNYVYGDVDGDGYVTASDVTAIYNYILLGDDSGLVNVGDIDGDGVITSSDVTAIYDYLNTGWPSHPYVNLGLPSGTLWAKTNVGAFAPEQIGDYFAWGETSPKDYYNWTTYKWCNGDYHSFTKYCTISNNGFEGFVDNLTELEILDDAATVNWGPEWQMPSREQIQELVDNCTWQWTVRGSSYGYLMTGPNGAQMFLPATGMRWDDQLYIADTYGYYWSRTLNAASDAYVLMFHYNNGSGNISREYSIARSYGQPVRPVRIIKNNPQE